MSKKAPMITDSNQECFAELATCGLQEGSDENNLFDMQKVLMPPSAGS
jgi:hypothetical protein